MALQVLGPPWSRAARRRESGCGRARSRTTELAVDAEDPHAVVEGGVSPILLAEIELVIDPTPHPRVAFGFHSSDPLIGLASVPSGRPRSRLSSKNRRPRALNVVVASRSPPRLSSMAGKACFKAFSTEGLVVPLEIGRASCRERGEMAGDVVAGAGEGGRAKRGIA